MVILDIRSLRTYFHTSKGVVRAVDGVDLTIDREEVVGLVGESGSGKTVTALSIMGLVPGRKVVSGEIAFKDRNLLMLPAEAMQKVRGKGIAMVFQDPMSYLNPVMKVGNQIAEAIELHTSVAEGEARNQILRIMSELGIPAPARVCESYPHELSGGMRQRALIAMAISCDPELLILDEPTTALDVTVQIQILELLKRIRKEKQLSFLLITHDLGIAAEICDRIYVMYAGRIVETADIFELFDKPKHPYTQGLLRSVLSIDEFREKLVVLEGTVPNLVNPPSGCRFRDRCPYAMPVCSERENVPTEIGDAHKVFCWLYEERIGHESPVRSQ